MDLIVRAVSGTHDERMLMNLGLVARENIQMSPHRTVIVALTSALGGMAAAADAPLCCRIFDIDATPILGKEAVLCGTVPDADTTDEAAAAKRSAKACALDAQSRGRAFVYTYRELLPPDVDLIVQAVFGAHGERLLLKAGRFGRQDARMTQVCEKLAVRSDGTLDSTGCYQANDYFDLLRPVPW